MKHTLKSLCEGLVLPEIGDFIRGDVTFQSGCILGIHTDCRQGVRGTEVIDCTGKLVVPGFIDTHVHGARGRNFMEGTKEAIAAISGYLVLGGTTACLATTTSVGVYEGIRALTALLDAYRHPVQGQVEILGTHLEGPFINPTKRGAHMECNIRAVSMSELELLYATACESLKVVTLAPEIKNAADAVKFLVSKGVSVSIGHTEADFEQAKAALLLGANRGTHLFNAMPQIHHRQPGAVVALLLSPDTWLELTFDGNHFTPEIAQMVSRVAGNHRCVLISDGTDVRGQGDGTFKRWEGTEVFVSNGQALTQKGGLAGSMISMSDAVRNTVSKAGFPICDAVRMASENPARSIGEFARKGSITPGKDADFAILNPDLSVHMTIARGEIVYRGDSCS